MPQSYTCLNYHLIFSTKNRAPLISRELQPRLFEYFGGLFRQREGTLLAAGGVPDHVHLLAGIDRESSVAETLRDIKSISSGWIHKTFPDLADFAWQDGYATFSVSFSQIPAIKRYLGRQEKHHQKQTFQEEFLEFLRRHEVAYDERYIFQ